MLLNLAVSGERSFSAKHHFRQQMTPFTVDEFQKTRLRLPHLLPWQSVDCGYLFGGPDLDVIDRQTFALHHEAVVGFVGVQSGVLTADL